jgi:hypothetical protein
MWIRIRIWSGIKMENQIRIRIGNKMMPIHNTAHTNARTDTIQA